MNTDYLAGWDAKRENQKALFMERLYQHSGRTNGLFTGLWQEFCINEAGPLLRDQFFEKLEAIHRYKEQAKISKEEFMPTFHD